MPLPKPSKMISKRFKKPKAVNPFIKPPPPPPSPHASSASREQPLHHMNKLWPETPLRKWRVRVVCTDPDATDDSSADELDTSTSPNSARKRLLHEIFLPLPPSSPPPPSARTRRRRQSSNSDIIARSRKFCRDFRDSEDMDTLFDAASEICIGTVHHPPTSPQNRAMMLPVTECGAAEEEFARFLSEFVPDNGEDGTWDDGIDGFGLPQDDDITDMLNLELDSEALTWINSLQRLP